MARRRRNRFISQAAEEALVRFNPERSALMELLLSAKEDRRTTVRQARGTAASTIREIDRTRPQVKRDYRDAGLAQARTAHLLNEETAGLGPVANSIRAGISLERATGSRHLTEDRTEDLTDLSDRRVRAREGAQYAVQNAGNVYQGEVGKVQRRLLSMAQEEGAFTAATARELRTAAQDRGDKFRLERMGNRQSERNSLRSAGIDPKTGRPIPGGKLDPKAEKNKGKGWATDAAHERAQDTIQSATREATTLKQAGASRAEIAALLSAGAKDKETPVYDPNTGKKKLNPDGTPVVKSVPGIPQIKSQLYLSAALDMIFDGHLSRRNQRLLHSRGIQLGRLPVTTYGQWRRKQGRATLARPPLAKGHRNQQRPT